MLAIRCHVVSSFPLLVPYLSVRISLSLSERIVSDRSKKPNSNQITANKFLLPLQRGIETVFFAVVLILMMEANRNDRRATNGEERQVRDVECVEMYKWIFRNADFNSGCLLLACHVGSGRRPGVGVGALREISPRILISIPRAEKRELVRCLLTVF